MKPTKFFLNLPDRNAGGFSVELRQVYLHMKRFKIYDALAKTQMDLIHEKKARFPLTTRQIKTYNIRSGTTVVRCENLITDKMPSKLFAVFVEKSAYTGSFTNDPYEFKPHNFESVTCHFDGVQNPRKEYTADFDTGDYVNAYYNLFEALNDHDAHTVCDITPSQFGSKSFVIGFNFEPDLSNGVGESGYWNPNKKGHFSLTIRFKTQTTEDLYLVALCQFNSLYELDIYSNLKEVNGRGPD